MFLKDSLMNQACFSDNSGFSMAAMRADVHLSRKSGFCQAIENYITEGTLIGNPGIIKRSPFPVDSIMGEYSL